MDGIYIFEPWMALTQKYHDFSLSARPQEIIARISFIFRCAARKLKTKKKKKHISNIV